MISEFVEMYESGKITAHHLAIECLRMIDPQNPELVLHPLPADVMDSVRQYIREYEPGRMRTNYGLQPTTDQIEAAAKWIAANIGSREVEA